MTETTAHPDLARAALETRLPTPGTFILDPVHTYVGFVAKHLMVAKVRGQFIDVAGSIVLADDPSSSRAEATVRTASISTSSAPRDEHLRSADFFDCDRYADMTFRSRQVVAHDDQHCTVVGQLTIKDQTHPVRLDVELHGQVVDPWGQQRTAWSATAEIDRRDFGLAWNNPLEGGGLMVGNAVRIEIEAEAVRQS